MYTNVSFAKNYIFPFNYFCILAYHLVNYLIALIAIHMNFVYDNVKSLKECAYTPFLPKINPNVKAVIVTGSASGFGFEFVKQLDALGFTVFAGCRDVNDSRAKSLLESCSKRVKLVKCDVTSDEEVNSAVKFVAKQLGDKCLWGIISNAGMGCAQWLDWGRPGCETYEKLMNVNVIGNVRLVKAFLPLIRKTKGSRIVLVSSNSAKFTFPCLGPYGMSKAALSSFGNSLRRELSQWQCYVSIVEPTAFRTPMLNETTMRDVEQIWAETPDYVKKVYPQSLVDDIFECVKLGLGMAKTDITPVTDAIVDSMTSSSPNAYYEPSSLNENLQLQFAKFSIPDITDTFLSIPGALRVFGNNQHQNS